MNLANEALIPCPQELEIHLGCLLCVVVVRVGLLRMMSESMLKEWIHFDLELLHESLTFLFLEDEFGPNAS